MANNKNVSLKHIQIDKTYTVVLIVVALAAFVLVFSGFAASALITQRNYQARVIAEKEKARDQLEQNLAAAESLQTSYQAFISTPQNIIGGASSGDGERDGDNARIVLDALPSAYDFPALITSLEKILQAENVQINSISGSDDELSQGDLAGEGPVEMPFALAITGDYESNQSLIDTIERSIRPFNINVFTLRGDDDSLRLEIRAHSYFQPEKVFQVSKEVVR